MADQVPDSNGMLPKKDNSHGYISNFNFVLRVDGAFDVPLKSVRPFTRENEYDYIQEGGLNDYVHIRRKPVSKPFQLVCERYIPASVNDPLSNGTEFTLPLLLFVGKNQGGDYDLGRYYVFTGAVVMSKEYGGLDAEHSGLLTETVTIGYNRMFCITMESDDSSKPAWIFEQNKVKQDYSGKVGREIKENEVRKKEIIEKSSLWEFGKDKKEVEGNNKRHLNKTESQGEEAKKANLWEFKEDGSREGTGTRSAVEYLDGQGETRKEDMKANLWEFLEDGSREGSGPRSAAEYLDGYGETRKEDMEANLWEFFEDGRREGSGPRSAVEYLDGYGETRKKDMESSLWEFGKDKKEAEGNKNRHVNKADIKKVVKEDKKEATLWEFGKDKKEVEGNNKRHVNKVDIKKVVKEDKKEATLWEYGKDKKDVEGNKKRHVNKVDIKKSVSGDTKKANLWEFDKADYKGKGKTSRVTKDIKGNSKTKSDLEQKAKKGVKKTVEDYGIKKSEEKARKWEFGDKGQSSRNTDATKDPSKNDMVSKAKSPAEFGKVPNPVKAQFSSKAVQGVKEINPNKPAGTQNTREPAKFGTVPNPVKAQFSGRAAHRVKATNPYKPTGKMNVRKPSKFGAIPNPEKDKMAKKAAHHVKRTVADFLMKK